MTRYIYEQAVQSLHCTNFQICQVISCDTFKEAAIFMRKTQVWVLLIMSPHVNWSYFCVYNCFMLLICVLGCCLGQEMGVNCRGHLPKKQKRESYPFCDEILHRSSLNILKDNKKAANDNMGPRYHSYHHTY